jgi:hypothetical protein
MTLVGSFTFSDRSPFEPSLAVPRRFPSRQGCPAAPLAGASPLWALEGHR